jgi:4-amino-4-deoxy-L-arabinose transferase-like glycosyltransferase
MTERVGLERFRAVLARHRVVLAIFLLVFGVYALNAGGHMYSIDDEGYFFVTEAALDGRLHIDVRPDRPDVFTVSAPDGKTAYRGNIGTSLLATPLLAGAKGLEGFVEPEQQSFFERLFVGWTSSITGALTACVLYLIARRLGASQRLAIAISLVFAFCTFFMPHSKTFFIEPTAALLVALTFLLGLRARERGTGNWPFFLAGLSAGAAINMRTSVAPLVGISLVATVLAYARTGAARRAVVERGAVGVAGLVPGVVFLLWSQWVRFGDAFDWGHPGQNFDTPFYEGLYGQFLSPGKGLVFFAPVVVLAAILFPRFARRRPAIAVEVAAIVIVNSLLFATFENWSGDNAFGPRYMAIVLPLALVPLVELGGRRVFRWAFAGLAAVGLLVPSFIGNLTYFITVQGEYKPDQIEAVGLGATAASRPLTYQENIRVLRAGWFEPRFSQLVEGARIAPATVRNTRRVLTDAGFRERHAAPPTERERLFWFGGVAVLDIWPVWILLWAGPKWLYVFAVVFLACAVTGVLVLARALRSPPPRRVPDTPAPQAGHAERVFDTVVGPDGVGAASDRRRDGR